MERREVGAGEKVSEMTPYRGPCGFEVPRGGAGEVSLTDPVCTSPSKERAPSPPSWRCPQPHLHSCSTLLPPALQAWGLWAAPAQLPPGLFFPFAKTADVTGWPHEHHDSLSPHNV